MKFRSVFSVFIKFFKTENFLIMFLETHKCLVLWDVSHRYDGSKCITLKNLECYQEFVQF